jgi:hypothetical protein
LAVKPLARQATTRSVHSVEFAMARVVRCGGQLFETVFVQRILSDKADIGLRVGRVIDRYKVA